MDENIPTLPRASQDDPLQRPQFPSDDFLKEKGTYTYTLLN